jgi:hypothetical protein
LEMAVMTPQAPGSVPLIAACQRGFSRRQHGEGGLLVRGYRHVGFGLPACHLISGIYEHRHRVSRGLPGVPLHRRQCKDSFHGVGGAEDGVRCLECEGEGSSMEAGGERLLQGRRIHGRKLHTRGRGGELHEQQIHSCRCEVEGEETNDGRRGWMGREERRAARVGVGGGQREGAFFP